MNIAELHRRAIEASYTDRCTVTASVPVKRKNGSTGHETQVVYSDLPCRLSYESVPAAAPDTNTATVAQAIKLFLAPEYAVAAGSVISVTHDGVTEEYRRSGVPASYATHQEIPLMLTKERA
ncbi:MAG: hypothetical protein IJK23_10185 [Clostridia bacterium]|nr:hypothetical protein [Clostridia bacterium]